MRLVKPFLFTILGLAMMVIAFSLLIPSQIRVSRATIINNVTPKTALQVVSNLEYWKKWHPAFKAEGVIIDYNELSSPNTCTLTYNGKSTLISITAKDSAAVHFTLSSLDENTIQNDIIVSDPTGNGILQVEWRALTTLKWYPWEKFYGIFIDRLTGPTYEEALQSLKTYLEANTATSPVN